MTTEQRDALYQTLFAMLEDKRRERDALPLDDAMRWQRDGMVAGILDAISAVAAVR